MFSLSALKLPQVLLGRHSYATLPDAAAVARRASTPRAVRLRRIKMKRDQLKTGPTLTDEIRYTRLQQTGQLISSKSKSNEEQHEPNLQEWVAKKTAHQSRIRGVVDGSIVGKRIYLPNILFTLVRNHTPSKQPYNPYEATFRVPKSLTKLDVRAYLNNVYGVQCTYIRTDNYMNPITRNHKILSWHRAGNKNYKRTVVGLVEPFYFPNRFEDMNPRQKREWRKELIQWGMEELDKQKAETIFSLRPGLKPGWKVKPKALTTRWRILKAQLHAKRVREGKLADKVKDMLKQDEPRQLLEA